MDFLLKGFIFLQLCQKAVLRFTWSLILLLIGCVCWLSVQCCVMLCVDYCESMTASLPLFQISALRLPRGYQGKCSLLVSLWFFHTVIAAPTSLCRMALTSWLHPLCIHCARSFSHGPFHFHLVDTHVIHTQKTSFL